MTFHIRLQSIDFSVLFTMNSYNNDVNNTSDVMIRKTGSRITEANLKIKNYLLSHTRG